MNEYFAFALLAFTSFFTLMNPIGVMPVFISMTTSLTQQERTQTARKAVLVAFITLVLFALSGQLLFTFFGISVDSFRVAGGIIFFFMGFDMLQARLSPIKLSNEEAVQAYVTDISVTPLGIPMITGPGAITNAIVLMEDAENTGKKVVLFAMMAFVCLLTFIALWGATYLTRLLGDTGNKIMMRLMGLIVMVIAVEFFFSGMGPILVRIIQASRG
ncbi:MAG: NAAT family transporter [Bacteroidia bacterium]|nr:NAAT family transporter [Bacteroidia bacterium]